MKNLFICKENTKALWLMCFLMHSSIEPTFFTLNSCFHSYANKFIVDGVNFWEYTVHYGGVLNWTNIPGHNHVVGPCTNIGNQKLSDQVEATQDVAQEAVFAWDTRPKTFVAHRINY